MPAHSPTQVVDETDQPIGVETRSDIHAQGLWHRIIGVWLMDGDGNLLMQRRQSGRGLDDDKLDGSASGHVDPGESYEQAAIREASEELGVTLSLDDLEEVAYFKSQATHLDKQLNRFTKLFIARVDRDNLEVTHKQDELSDTVWMSSNEVKDLVTETPERTVPGIVIAWHIWQGVDIPANVTTENQVQVIVK